MGIKFFLSATNVGPNSFFHPFWVFFLTRVILELFCVRILLHENIVRISVFRRQYKFFINDNNEDADDNNNMAATIDPDRQHPYRVFNDKKRFPKNTPYEDKLQMCIEHISAAPPLCKYFNGARSKCNCLQILRLEQDEDGNTLHSEDNTEAVAHYMMAFYTYKIQEKQRTIMEWIRYTKKEGSHPRKFQLPFLVVEDNNDAVLNPNRVDVEVLQWFIPGPSGGFSF